jgi:signal transduction histidine kinase
LNRRGACAHCVCASLQAAHERERKSLSLELHDDLGQLLTAILFDIAQLRKPEIVFTSGTKGILERIQDGTEEALQRVQSLSAILRPGVLDQLGVESAPGQGTTIYVTPYRLSNWRYNSYRSEVVNGRKN